MAKMEIYVATLCLVRDPAVSNEELVRAFSDWKLMKAEGKHPPKWVQAETPDTLEGVLRLMFSSGDAEPGTRSYLDHTIFGMSTRGRQTNACAYFLAEAERTPSVAQALSFMAYGLRPGTYLDVARSRGPGAIHRRYEVVLNGDGEPEVEEVVPK